MYIFVRFVEFLVLGDVTFTLIDPRERSLLPCLSGSVQTLGTVEPVVVKYQELCRYPKDLETLILLTSFSLIRVSGIRYP